jgi:hypothetical protein
MTTRTLPSAPPCRKNVAFEIEHAQFDRLLVMTWDFLRAVSTDVDPIERKARFSSLCSQPIASGLQRQAMPRRRSLSYGMSGAGES